MAGHVFVSYVRDDVELVDQLIAALRASGLSVWLDRDSIGAGHRWKPTIHQAIRSGYLFIACFSRNYSRRAKSYMNEELTIAIEELRQRPKDRSWFIPVSLDGADIPYIEIGGGETLNDLQRLDFSTDVAKTVEMIVSAAASSAEAPSVLQNRRSGAALASARQSNTPTSATTRSAVDQAQNDATAEITITRQQVDLGAGTRVYSWHLLVDNTRLITLERGESAKSATVSVGVHNVKIEYEEWGPDSPGPQGGVVGYRSYGVSSELTLVFVPGTYVIGLQHAGGRSVFQRAVDHFFRQNDLSRRHPQLLTYTPPDDPKNA